MRVCFHGTDEEITRICERPVLALLGPRRTQPVLAFELSNVRISTDPYGTVFRLVADLTEVRREANGRD
ncbi:hypothetical protein SAMN05216276_109419 [Streptosporangium subroseum]|uniref:Uncharacterized protein n=1 Tax=Streptosporangium subroseum TaxID=106412 RepID=A0A239P754_9ACTN|nr:hypothetical protein [Streptosporangium subroseum]SNT62876.1 hypothetical protein SAMN05216276_109419 [Streptosporangium subroseum]